MCTSLAGSDTRFRTGESCLSIAAPRLPNTLPPRSFDLTHCEVFALRPKDIKAQAALDVSLDSLDADVWKNSDGSDSTGVASDRSTLGSAGGGSSSTTKTVMEIRPRPSGEDATVTKGGKRVMKISGGRQFVEVGIFAYRAATSPSDFLSLPLPASILPYLLPTRL